YRDDSGQPSQVRHRAGDRRADRRVGRRSAVHHGGEDNRSGPSAAGQLPGAVRLATRDGAHVTHQPVEDTNADAEAGTYDGQPQDDHDDRATDRPTSYRGEHASMLTPR